MNLIYYSTFLTSTEDIFMFALCEGSMVTALTVWKIWARRKKNQPSRLDEICMACSYSTIEA